MSTRVDGAEQETENRYRHRVGDDVRYEPCEELEGYCSENQADDEKTLADAWGQVRKNKTSKCDTALYIVSIRASK